MPKVRSTTAPSADAASTAAVKPVVQAKASIPERLDGFEEVGSNALRALLRSAFPDGARKHLLVQLRIQNVLEQLRNPEIVDVNEVAFDNLIPLLEVLPEADRAVTIVGMMPELRDLLQKPGVDVSGFASEILWPLMSLLPEEKKTAAIKDTLPVLVNLLKQGDESPAIDAIGLGRNVIRPMIESLPRTEKQTAIDQVVKPLKIFALMNPDDATGMMADVIWPLISSLKAGREMALAQCIGLIDTLFLQIPRLHVYTLSAQALWPMLQALKAGPDKVRILSHTLARVVDMFRVPGVNVNLMAPTIVWPMIQALPTDEQVTAIQKSFEPMMSRYQSMLSAPEEQDTSAISGTLLRMAMVLTPQERESIGVTPEIFANLQNGSRPAAPAISANPHTRSISRTVAAFFATALIGMGASRTTHAEPLHVAGARVMVAHQAAVTSHKLLSFKPLPACLAPKSFFHPQTTNFATNRMFGR